jgi:hypothetical protein
MRTRLALIALVSSVGIAQATPYLPLDQPEYIEIARLRALGLIPAYGGGFRPLTELEVQRLLEKGGEPSDASLLPSHIRGTWVRPFQRVTFRLDAFVNEQRPYSTTQRPALIAGSVDLTCEHQEGRPCGGGFGFVSELDSSTGYGKWVSGFARLRLTLGTGNYDVAAEVDRAYFNAELGPFSAEVGRDVIALGPGVHTQLMWGDNAAPLDQLRVSTAHPLKIPRTPIDIFAAYFIGRLRSPQTFAGTIVTGARLQVGLFDQFQVGAQQLLQLGGIGAPHVSFGDFIVEHFTRTGEYPSVGKSNRRLSFDATYEVKWLRGARFYYELAFEDLRKEVLDAWVYDADHLAGIELPILTGDGRHGLVVEFQHIGVHSQTHEVFKTGLTNAGRAVGSPLGPDSWSIFGQVRIDVRKLRLFPWLEFARLSSDQYMSVVFGHIYRTATGTEESRFRAGLNGQLALRPTVTVNFRMLFEHVSEFGFTPNATRENLGAEFGVQWRPEIP